MRLKPLNRVTEAGGGVHRAVLARDRHLRALEGAREALAFNPAQLFADAPELAAERLRIASRELDTMTGIFTSEDLLGEIFSTFCIGK